MNISRNKIWTSILFCMILYSCKNSFFYEDGFTRLNRKYTIFEKQYDKIDSIVMRNIDYCFKKRLPGDYLKARLTTKGNILYNKDSIVRSINKSLHEHFNYVDRKPKENNTTKQNCDDFTNYDYRNSNDSIDLQTNSIHNIKVSLVIDAFTTKDFDVDHFLHVFDDDRHFVKYVLILSIYEGNNVIYLDNSVHWKTIISERNEQLNYVLPQSTIDALISKSLEQYYKQLE